MTSKTSLNSIFKIKLSQNSWLPALVAIAMFFTVVLPTLTMNYTSTDNIIYNPLVQLIAIAFAFLIPVTLFKYLMVKSEVDFYHSLPIRRERFFIGNYIVGILMFVIPFTLFYFIATLIAGIDSEILTTYLYALVNFLTMYSFTTLAIMLTGNIFMAVAVGSVFNFVLFGFYFVVYYLFQMLTLTSPKTLDVNVMLSTTPVCSMLSILMGESYTYNIIYIFLLGILSFVLAFITYKFRESEKASQAVVFKFFKPVLKYTCLFIGTILIGIFFATITNSFTWLILGILLSAFIINGIFEAIYEADFKSFFKNAKFIVLFLIFIISSIFVINYDIFGYDSKIPQSAADVSYIEITNNSNVATISSQENIDKFLYVMTESVESINKNNFQNSWSSTVITYHLQNGSSYSRNLPFSNYLTYNVSSFDNEETSTTLGIQLLEVYTSYEYVSSVNFDYDMSLFKDNINNISQYYIQKGYNNNYSDMKDIYKQEQLKTILELIEQDASNLTDEYLQDTLPCITLEVKLNNNFYTIAIYPNFESTLEFIDQYNLIDSEINYQVSSSEIQAVSIITDDKSIRITDQEQIQYVLDNMNSTVYGYSGYFPYNINKNVAFLEFETNSNSYAIESSLYRTYITADFANNF